MPWSPPRPCPGCQGRALIQRGQRRCPSCETTYNRQRRLDPVRRARQDFHASAAWKRFRVEILHARPRCEAGCGDPANEVAHVVPVVQRPDLAFEPTNVRALCKACHSSESARRRERWPGRTRGLVR